MTTAAPSDQAGFSVIIVNYNAGDRLQRCLAALAAQTRPADEIIVVDNGSVDRSLQNASEALSGAIVLAEGENLGFAVANNRAAARARGDWLAFLNPDAYPLPDWLAEVENALRQYPQYDAFGSLQIDANHTDRLDGAGDVYHGSGTPYRGHFGWPAATAPADGECFSPCAAAAIYRKSTFEALGGFEESFFCYCEDIDLGYRLRLRGGRALQLNRARVLHEGSGVSGRHSEFSIYHGHRNRVWTFIRNTPAPILILALPYFLCANLVLLAQNALQGRGGVFVRAMRDALTGAPYHWRMRKRIHAQRRASLASIFAAITWSPFALLRRRADIREAELPNKEE